MKRIYLLFALVISAMYTTAGIVTYTFTSKTWESQLGTVKCDGLTDGWISHKDAAHFDKQTSYLAHGVKVTSSFSGAGAKSVKSFKNINRIVFNYGTTADGKGSIKVQIGANPSIDTVITKSTSNQDFVIDLPEPQSGYITFYVNCTKNSLFLSSITLRADSTPFTQVSYQMVTDVNQLKDSDQIIFGASAGDYIMSFFDESFSKNNIKAIPGVYAADRQTVNENEAAVYTLRTIKHNNKTRYLLVDDIRYYSAYLVASGGQTKNRLALWGDYTSSMYGDYGIWDITIAANGDATIASQGVSLGKYIQLNESSPTGAIYGCYQNLNYTSPRIYHRVEGIGDQPTIVAPIANFGTMVKKGTGVLEGAKTILINANNLTDTIRCALRQSNVFSLDTNRLDKNGDYLTIRYQADTVGQFVDTLELTSGEVSKQILVFLDVQPLRTISQVVEVDDYTMVYLDSVVVTKKYDKYVFIRDATGSMLIWDATNPATGKPYAQDLKNGHVLTNVQGRFRNYYGVPELSPSAAWKVGAKKLSCEPDTVLTVDSADVCRYVRIEKVVVEDGLWQGIPVLDKFNTGVKSGVTTTLDAIVMIDHDVLQLWIVKQTTEQLEEKSIAEATQSEDVDYVLLNSVVVTKKYDQYVFVRDETGSMLILDTLNTATKIDNGHQLSNVQGSYLNHGGVPELTSADKWTVAAKKVTCNPEEVTQVDSADVCRYVRIEDVVVVDNTWQGIAVVDKFGAGVKNDVESTIDAIVMIDQTEVQLWVVKQTEKSTGLAPVHNTQDAMYKYIRDGQFFIRLGENQVNANGQTIK